MRKTQALAAGLFALSLLANIPANASTNQHVGPQIMPAPSTVTDLSTLHIIPITDAQNETITVQLDPSETKAPAETAQTRTDIVPCGGRIDFYRIISHNTGDTWCFAMDGTIHFGPVPVNLVCPGENTGRILWRRPTDPPGQAFWSIPRNGYGDNNRCYSFDSEVYTSRLTLWR